MSNFDYIILGAGAAGLMLARAMAEDEWFQSKSVLIIDKDDKKLNDRTWCFWEDGPGTFDNILHRQWGNVFFNSSLEDRRLSIAPYTYKMIRGVDFYTHQFKAINQSPNIKFLQADVNSVVEGDESVKLDTSQGTFSGTLVLNSLFDIESIRKQDKYPVLRQHFIGWFVKTNEAIFDQEAATFMDFSVPQKGNTRFMYVLPFSANEALVEYTLFSEDLLEDTEYEAAIQTYLESRLGAKDYEIVEKEKGQIPMSCFDFEAANTARILNIGTAGGWAKASTGFTFKNTLRNTNKLLTHLKNEEPFESFTTRNKFHLYDILLLDILHKNNALGSVIFESLFRKRKPALILKFLDEQSNLAEDLMVISGCPTMPFTKALLRRLFGR